MLEGAVDWDKIRSMSDTDPSRARTEPLPQPSFPEGEGASLKDTLDRASQRFAASQTFDGWYTLIHEFTRRSLTESSDKLPAVSGLAARCQRNRVVTSATYIAGLWVEDLAAGLVWSVELARERRSEVSDPEPPYRAPSFSWASVDGPVSFHDTAYSLFMDPETELEVLDFSTTPAGADPLGKVSSAYITIRAYAAQLSALRGHYQFGAGILFDSWKAEKAFDPETTEGLAVYLGRNQDAWVASGSQRQLGDRILYLLLVPVDERQVMYKRIGLMVGLDDITLEPHELPLSKIMIV